MNTNLMIETQDLTRVYGDGEEIRALDGVTMSIEAGEFVAVMGPSGSGKSTLLHVLDAPTSGKVLVNGQDLATLRDVDRFRARTVGFMFQLHNLLPTLTAPANAPKNCSLWSCHLCHRHPRPKRGASNLPRAGDGRWQDRPQGPHRLPVGRRPQDVASLWPGSTDRLRQA